MKKYSEAEKKSNLQTYLVFGLNNELFAFNVHKVINIIKICPVTKVPHTPPYVKGVFNLRGDVIPLIDLRLRFGLPEGTITEDTAIIILTAYFEGDDVMLGALVDSVQDVLDIDDASVEPFPAIGSKYNVLFVAGLFKLKERVILILDVDNIFGGTEDMVAKAVEKNEGDTGN
ncbi:MAG: chemotaxis protein CheW [Bacteroidales bacterium]